jgi:hypothetical protein
MEYDLRAVIVFNATANHGMPLAKFPYVGKDESHPLFLFKF